MQRTPCDNTYHATCNRHHASRNAHHARCNTHHAHATDTCIMQQISCNMQLPITPAQTLLTTRMCFRAIERHGASACAFACRRVHAGAWLRTCVCVCMCVVACVCVELRVCACMCRQSAAQCESVSRRERAGVRAQPRARTIACECTPYGRRAPRCGSPAIRTSIVRPFVEARRPAWGFRSIRLARELRHHVGRAESSSSSSGSSSAESQRHIALQNAEAFPNRSFRSKYGRAAATTACRRPHTEHVTLTYAASKRV